MGVGRIERIKLVATSINNVALAIVLTAVVVPTISSGGNGLGSHVLQSVLWFLVAGVLHFVAQAVLGRLDP